MLLDLKRLIKIYNLKIKGVIHVGANTGQEVFLYEELDIKNGYFFEPCSEPFHELLPRIDFSHNDYSCYKYALGANDGTAIINKTKVNDGQSNSLLKPAKHLEYYPDIIFDETEEIEIRKLDNFNITSCNLLVADVQGFELEVLKGATETLKHIDYILTEVNKEEIYEGCPMVEDLDNYLKDFIRVRTKWTRHGWGDSLYIAKRLL